MSVAVLAPHVVHVVGRHQRQPQPIGKLHQALVLPLDHLLVGLAASLHL